MGPKVEPEEGVGLGMRFHVREKLSVSDFEWVYDEDRIDLYPTGMLLCRVIIGKVEDVGRLRDIFQRTPVRAARPGWNCVEWVKEAVESAIRDSHALETNVESWGLVRDAAMWYVAEKKVAHRFDGTVPFDNRKAATWNLLEGFEQTP